MKKSFYHSRERIGYSQKFNKFNTIFESVMSGIPAFDNVKADPTLFLRRPDLNLLLEEIEKPQYVISESTGDAILLEECLFWSEKQLIMEGILDKVLNKVKEIYEKIKEAIVNIISDTADAIKSFCDKMMNIGIVKAIRKKLGLDEKLNKEKFRSFVTCKNAKGEVITESVMRRLDEMNIISEAAKLSKKEEAITDSDEIQKYIKKYQDAISGKKVLKNKKTGEPLSSKYLKQKLKLWKDKLESSSESGNESEADAEDTGSDTVANTDNSEEKSKGKKTTGTISINTKKVTSLVQETGEESTADDTVKAASKSAAVVEGGDEAKKELGGEEAPKEEKKQGLFDKIGNKLKAGIQKVTGAVKDWFAKQNKWVKMLIWVIIGILAIAALVWLFTAVILPICAVIIHGGIVAAGGAIFQLAAAGKTFYSTYKAGQTAWKTGTGWGKFFMLCGASILACMAIGKLAAAGKQIMDQMNSDKAPAGGEGKGEEAKAEQNEVKKEESAGIRKGKAMDLDQKENGGISKAEQAKLDAALRSGKNTMNHTPKVIKTGDNSASIQGYMPQSDQTYHDFLKKYAANHNCSTPGGWKMAQNWASMMAKKKLMETGGASYTPIGKDGSFNADSLDDF